jgi:hypothetical protein
VARVERRGSLGDVLPRSAAREPGDMDGGGGGGGGGGEYGQGGGAHVPAATLKEPSAVASDGSDRAHVVELLRQSRVRWLKNTEVCDILLNYKAYDFSLSASAPVQPPGE